MLNNILKFILGWMKDREYKLYLLLQRCYLLLHIVRQLRGEPNVFVSWRVGWSGEGVWQQGGGWGGGRKNPRSFVDQHLCKLLWTYNIEKAAERSATFSVLSG